MKEIEEKERSEIKRVHQIISSKAIHVVLSKDASAVTNTGHGIHPIFSLDLPLVSYYLKVVPWHTHLLLF